MKPSEMELYDHESDEEQEDLTDVSENVKWLQSLNLQSSAAQNFFDLQAKAKLIESH